MNKILSMLATGTIGILALLIPYTCAIAQDPEWILYDTSNSGLPSNNVWSIAIEENGTKWMAIGGDMGVGGYGGITSFDGSTWTVYDTSNSGLPSNEVFAIAIDGDGTKWVGTDQGLASFNGTSWAVYNTSNSEIPVGSVLIIAIDGNGTKWLSIAGNFGEGGYSLTSFDGNNWTVYDNSNSGLPNNAITAITVDDTDRIWLGTNGAHLASFDGISWIVYNLSDPVLTGDHVTSIAIDGNGFLWIGTMYGLRSFDGTDFTGYDEELYPEEPAHRSISTIAIDASGKKWIGIGLHVNVGPTFGGGGDGFCSYDDETWAFYDASNSGLPSDYISSILIDTDGNMWMSTTYPFFPYFGGGLVVYNEGGLVANDDEDLSNSQPSDFRLFQNYPNPFNPTTTIQYSLPEAGLVKLIIFDIRGREIITLEQSEKAPGNHAVQWNGMDQWGNPVSTGVYLARLNAGSFSQTIKMVYLR